MEEKTRAGQMAAADLLDEALAAFTCLRLKSTDGSASLKKASKLEASQVLTAGS